MSRNTTTNNNNSLVPLCTSSESPLECSIENHFYTVNVIFNYGASSDNQNPQVPLAAISNLIGQQIKDINKDRQHRTCQHSTSSNELLPEVDAIPLETPVTPFDDSEVTTTSPVKMQKKRYSSEYQDLTNIQSKCRLVVNPYVSPVPEEELPPKKFHKDRKRREYVRLGSFRSKETGSGEKSRKKEEKKKRRKRSKEMGFVAHY